MMVLIVVIMRLFTFVLSTVVVPAIFHSLPHFVPLPRSMTSLLLVIEMMILMGILIGGIRTTRVAISLLSEMVLRFTMMLPLLLSLTVIVPELTGSLNRAVQAHAKSGGNDKGFVITTTARGGGDVVPIRLDASAGVSASSVPNGTGSYTEPLS